MRRGKQLLIAIGFLLMSSGITLAAQQLASKPQSPPVTKQVEKAAAPAAATPQAAAQPQPAAQPKATAKQPQPTGQESDALLNDDIDKELNGNF